MRSEFNKAQVVCISDVNKYDNNYKCVFIISSAALYRPSLCKVLYTCTKTWLQKCKATKEKGGGLQKATLRALGNNWQKPGVAQAVQHRQSPCWPWAGGPTQTLCVPPLSSPAPPKANPLLPAPGNTRKKLGHLILSSSGPPSSLCTS